MKRVTLLFCFILYVLIPAFTQEFFFDNYSTSHGLAGSKVYCIEENSDHFIWLGTDYGISRFDGSTFLSYTTEEGLSEGGVKCITEDRFGQMIFGHYDGNISILKNHLFRKIDTLHIQGDVRKIYEDGDNLWIATDGSGAYKISALENDWDWDHPVQYMGKEGLSNRVFDIEKLKSGELLFIAHPIVKYLDKEDLTFKVFKQGIIPAYFQVTCLLETKNDFLYLGTFNGGIYRIDLKTDELIFYDEKNGLSHNFVMALKEDKEGRIWVATFGGGVNVISESGIIKIQQNEGVIDHLIQSLIVNDEGLVLIGTNSNGLQIFKGFQFSNSKNFSKEKLRVNGITKLGSIYYGACDNGIFSFSLANQDPIQISDFKLEELDYNFRFIQKSKNEELWLATEFQGVFKYNVKSKSLDKVSELSPYLFNNKINAFEVDSKGDLWIGTIDGIVHYKVASKETQRLSQEDNLISRNISALYEKNDTVFVGFQEAKRGINYIYNDFVYRIQIPYVITPTSFIKKGKELWIGTLNHGVFVIDQDTIKYRVNSKNGLLNDHVQFIDQDQNGTIWIGNNQGLNAIKDFNNYWVENYTSEQGVLNEQIVRDASFLDGNNRLWVATSNAMIINSINNSPKDLRPARPVIEGVYINDKKSQNLSIGALRYDQNNILIKVAATNLYAPDKTIFYYKIDGYNSNWVALSGGEEINLMNLNPGDYTLNIKSIGFDGNEQFIDEAIEWTIKPPWYLSIWFIMFCIIFTFLIFGIYIKLRERNLKREKEILEVKVVERTRLISLKNHQLAQKNKDITDSLQYASRIQNAVLPSSKILEPFGFIYFRPKDIVSGDFYFISKQENAIYICAADCTGHGVPGALLSIMGRNIMDIIMSSDPDIMPGKFLDRLNYEVAETLQKDKSQTINDGMDLSLVKISFDQKKVYYAGAYNPLYLIRNNELIELKADRFSIGSQKIMPDLNYQTQEIEFKENDRIYLFSDGLPDQFGGIDGKKLKTSGLKNELLRIQQYEIMDQEKMLNGFFNSWQEDEEQVDDILLIGFEISELILQKKV